MCLWQGTSPFKVRIVDNAIFMVLGRLWSKWVDYICNEKGMGGNKLGTTCGSLGG